MANCIWSTSKQCWLSPTHRLRHARLCAVVLCTLHFHFCLTNRFSQTACTLAYCDAVVLSIYLVLFCCYLNGQSFGRNINLPPAVIPFLERLCHFVSIFDFRWPLLPLVPRNAIEHSVCVYNTTSRAALFIAFRVLCGAPPLRWRPCRHLFAAWLPGNDTNRLFLKTLWSDLRFERFSINPSTRTASSRNAFVLCRSTVGLSACFCTRSSTARCPSTAGTTRSWPSR